MKLNVCTFGFAALGYAIGRIGCQLAGDGDYGDVTTLPWGMAYPEGTVPTTQIVHPTPVYETLASLVIFWVLWRMRGRLTAPWALFGLYLVLAGVERFAVEFVRATPVVVAGDFKVAATDPDVHPEFGDTSDLRQKYVMRNFVSERASCFSIWR